MARRRLRTAAAAFLLAAGGIGVGTAHADNASQTCTAAGNGGTTHGGCVSVAQAGNATALLSDLCAQHGLQQATATTNRGQCLKVLRSMLP